MKFINPKKGEVTVAAILLIVIILVFIGWLVSLGGKECRSNNDCGKNSYCGSDFACHQIPIIEKTPVVVERHYTLPALIIGISIIITAVILKWDILRPKRKEVKESPEDLYTSKLKAP